MIGSTFLSSFLVVVITTLLVSGIAQGYEVGYDYPGGDYISHHQNIGSAQQCADICRNTSSCVVFTWVKPGVQGPTGICWLKSSMSSKVANSCCTSGIIRQAKQDYCEWHQVASSYSCNCKSSKTGKWYQTNPGACTQPKPTPRYVAPNNLCPPGQVYVGGAGVFGQGTGSGGRCVPK